MIAARSTCPQEIRTANRRVTLQQWWNCAEYRELVLRYLTANPKCVFCGSKATTVHHDNDWMYRSREEYFNPDNFTATCFTCHERYRKGLVICRVCRKHYHARGKEMCRHCSSEAMPKHKRRKRNLYHKRQRHPCGRRFGMQKCRRNGATYICPHSAKKAGGACEYFMMRKGTTPHRPAQERSL